MITYLISIYLYYLKTNYHIENNTKVLSFLNSQFKDSPSTFCHYIIFSHEYYFYDGKSITNKNHLDEIGEFATFHLIPFDYPQNYISSIYFPIPITKNIIHNFRWFKTILSNYCQNSPSLVTQ